MSILTEVVGQFLFRFTRGVTEHCNPEEPEFTAETLGYNPLKSTGRERYYQPVNELIYQKYSDREATTWDYLGSSGLDIKVINACSPDEETDEHQEDDRAMAWKRLRPSGVSKPLLCHLLDVHQGKKGNLRCREDARKTHPRDGSLSVSNPTRALDTLSGYHGSAGRKTYEMTEEKTRNE